MSEVRAEILAKILLVQNIVGQLPDKASIFSFLARALTDIPGVTEARFEEDQASRTITKSSTEPPVPGQVTLPLSVGPQRYGELRLSIGDPAAFKPYAPFLGNLCSLIAIILEERRQRSLNEAHQNLLEQRIQERTAQLQEEKEWLAVTLRSIGDGVITTDVNGALRGMNRVAEQLTGWSSHQATGRPLTEVFQIINEETRQLCENPCEKVLRTGLIVELANHTVLISKDGTERPIADSAAPIRDKNSDTVGVVLVFRDMTEKYKLLANAQRNDRLDALGILAGGIAHDFNNLLAGLFGYLDQAQRLSSENLVVLNLEKALSVYGRARDLTQQLLTFSKGGTPIKHTGDLRPLLRESSAFALSGTNIACSCEFEPDLWVCDFDKNQLAQVIDNILINAHQAMPNGGRVQIRAQNVRLESLEHSPLPAGAYLKISISDTGIGIPQDKIHRIFDPFYTTKQTGNGLGLATCHSIIRKHDGTIEVDSVLGQGTRFDIYLPASHRGTKCPTDEKPVMHHGQGRMLVMDDEDYMRDVLSMAFKTMGYETATATDGAGAVALWQQAKREENPFKGIFLDLTIKGGMGGKEASKLLRELGAEMPIVATSGYSGDPIISKPAENGFTASIQKPFTLEDLSALMNQHFR